MWNISEINHKNETSEIHYKRKLNCEKNCIWRYHVKIKCNITYFSIHILFSIWIKKYVWFIFSINIFITFLMSETYIFEKIRSALIVVKDSKTKSKVRLSVQIEIVVHNHLITSRKKLCFILFFFIHYLLQIKTSVMDKIWEQFFIFFLFCDFFSSFVIFTLWDSIFENYKIRIKYEW
jgi:hypothetical protein